MENNEKFFRNVDCKYFPCHEIEDDSQFNCMFCYCPLYYLGENCGGSFKITDSGKKSCINCNFPHKAENYQKIMEKLREANVATVANSNL